MITIGLFCNAACIYIAVAYGIMRIAKGLDKLAEKRIAEYAKRMQKGVQDEN